MKSLSKWQGIGDVLSVVVLTKLRASLQVREVGHVRLHSRGSSRREANQSMFKSKNIGSLPVTTGSAFPEAPRGGACAGPVNRSEGRISVSQIGKDCHLALGPAGLEAVGRERGLPEAMIRPAGRRPKDGPLSVRPKFIGSD